MEFNATKEEHVLIAKIIERAKGYDIAPDPLSLSMDLDAVHSNGIPLDFEKLLNFPEFDFRHDIVGLQNKMNRAGGEPILFDFFLPRCSKPERMWVCPNGHAIEEACVAVSEDVAVMVSTSRGKATNHYADGTRGVTKRDAELAEADESPICPECGAICDRGTK
jgi:hypothetical protein